MKTCSKCNIEKNLNDFYKRKDTKDGFRSDCKECHNLLTKPGTLKYQSKESTIVKAKIHNKEYWFENKEKLKEKNKEKYYKNRIKYLLQKKEYYRINKEVISKKSSDYSINRMNIDFTYKFIRKIRGLIKKSIYHKGYRKNTKTEIILGISIVEFKNYIESKFEPWMSFENHGKYNGDLNYGWDIDHIIPLSSVVTEEDVIRLNHYTNLQPLCGYINRCIKRNNLDYIKEKSLP